MAVLPVPVFDEQRAVDHVASLVAVLLPRMSACASHARLAELLRNRLRRGDSIVIEKAIRAAERDDDWLADAVLRQTYFEMKDHGEPMSRQLETFGERAVLRPPVLRGRGRDEYADWRRNILICVLIQVTCADFNVCPTRSRSARRERRPSGCSLVKQALQRHKIHIEEQTIQQHIWLGGLLGTLVRQVMSERQAMLDQLDLGDFPIPQ